MADEIVPQPNQAPAPVAPPNSGLMNVSSAAAELQKTGTIKAQLPGNKGKKSNNRTLIILVLVVLVIVLCVLVVVTLTRRGPSGSSNDPRLKPTPTLIERPTPAEQTLGEPTAYNEDPQILQLEVLINTHAAQMDTADLTEPQTDFPNIVTDIIFK